MSFEEVRAAIGTEPDFIKRVLHSLACNSKYKVLTKTPEGNNIAVTDSFAANGAFSCPLRKVRIPMASLEDAGHSTKRVEEDR